MSEQSNDTGLGNVAYVVRSVEGAIAIARGNITNSKIETVDEIHNRLMAYDDIKRERDEAREKAERYRIEANAMMMQRDGWAAMCGRYKQERDEAIIKYTGQANEFEKHRNVALAKLEEAREVNAKLRDIAERAINYLDQSYRDGFSDEVSDFRYELEQLKEETK